MPLSISESLQLFADTAGHQQAHLSDGTESESLSPTGDTDDMLLVAHYTAAAVPSFFTPRPAQGTLQAKLQHQAQRHALQTRSELVLQEPEMKQIWYILVEYAKKDGDDIRIDYDGFSQVATRCREELGSHCDAYFRASAYLKFARDRACSVPVALFWQYIKERSHNLQMRIHLTYHDPSGSGSLSQGQLEEYIVSLIPDISALAAMPGAFVHHYKRITARKFVFFYGRNGVVRITELVGSQALNELLALKDPNLPESTLLSNWFSLQPPIPPPSQSAQRVFSCFQGLDADMSGTLSKEEFRSLGQGTMTDLFITRIFQEHVVKQRGDRPCRSAPARSSRPSGPASEMDLMAFVDFVLAWDNRAHVAAVPYFFRLLDINKQGYISHVELYIFFKEVYSIWLRLGEDPDVRVEDVIAEMIDMVQPRDPLAITQADFVRSKISGTVFGMLSSQAMFYNHNYWEHNLNK